MHRLASVEFINSKPLNFGLDAAADISLTLDVPSALHAYLAEERADAALLPVIDYQRLEDATIIPSAGIGCDGPTLTVRLFSRNPIEQCRTLACDSDSHTSVILARIILAERFNMRPELVPLRAAQGRPGEVRLLIGDKVVCEPPAGLPNQLDLGDAWKQLTGLPFVFAIWTARAGVELGHLPARLAQAKREGLAQVDRLIQSHAIPRGWPAGLARQYLTSYLQYDIGPQQLKAIELFHRKAHQLGVIDQLRPLKIAPSDSEA